MEKKHDTFSSVAIVIGTLILFSKTADVMGYFAPGWVSDFLGFNANMFYGWVNAAMVEGEILALHFNPRAQSYTPAQWVKWLLMLISLACQFFDGAIVTDTLSKQSEQIKAIFQFGVPAIPAIVVIMILLLGRMPEETKSQRGEWKGLEHAFQQLPKIWYGANYRPAPKITNAPMQVLGMETPQPKIKEPETVNPTQRRNGSQ